MNPEKCSVEIIGEKEIRITEYKELENSEIETMVHTFNVPCHACGKIHSNLTAICPSRKVKISRVNELYETKKKEYLEKNNPRGLLFTALGFIFTCFLCIMYGLSNSINPVSFLVFMALLNLTLGLIIFFIAQMKEPTAEKFEKIWESGYYSDLF